MRIGVLGGTFNPVHAAHLQMAVCARDTLGLDLTLLMVAADPPHKDVAGHVPAKERLYMTQLACAGLAGIEVSDLEVQRAGRSYTVETLQALHAKYPGAELFWIVGSDMLLDLPTWYRPDEVLRLSSIAYVPRIGQEQGDETAASALIRDFSARVVRLPAAAEPISSTEVRARLCDGRPADDLVPLEALLYAYKTGLYFPATLWERVQPCRAALPEKRWRHSAGTAIAAARLAARYKADFGQARLAALLHDCAKALPAKALCVLAGDDQDVSAVWHAAAGAVLAQTCYGVQDDAVLRAIRRHCTGEAGMGALDMTVYLADLSEPTRDFPGVEAIRRAIDTLPAEEAMLFALTRSEAAIKKRGAAGVIHPATQRAIQYFEKITKEERT